MIKYTVTVFTLFTLILVVELFVLQQPSLKDIKSKQELVRTIGLPDLALFSHQMRHRSLGDKFSQNSLDVALLTQDRASFILEGI
jgi:hypothetical protein